MAVLLVTRPSAAEGLPPSVIVLRASPADAEPWPEGTRAVIAELFTSGYELVGRNSSAKSLSELTTELERASSEPGIVGALAVFRQGARGLALVHTSARGLIRVEADATQGTVAESRLALQVAEPLRHVDIPTPPRETTEALDPQEPTPEPEPRPEPARLHRWQVWLVGGGVFASDLSRPFPWLGLTGAFSLASPLSLEATLGASVLSARADTIAGAVELQFQQGALYLTFDPFVENDVGVALGLGGGFVSMQESASEDPGFRGLDDSVRVGLVSARARAFVRSGRTSFLLALEPGLLIPAATVHIDETEALRIGRPWLGAMLGVGVSL